MMSGTVKVKNQSSQRRFGCREVQQRMLHPVIIPVHVWQRSTGKWWRGWGYGVISVE